MIKTNWGSFRGIAAFIQWVRSGEHQVSPTALIASILGGTTVMVSVATCVTVYSFKERLKNLEIEMKSQLTRDSKVIEEAIQSLSKGSKRGIS